MEIRRLTDIGSTNDYIMDLLGKGTGGEPSMNEWTGAVVSAHQTAGKGMGTNTWESEAGKNLLFSILVHPLWLEAANQYLLSMAEALALRDVLAEYADGITIKWPNDIYWQDKKISGTRIDGNIKGRYMADMVIGTGININQEVFRSDAPNPVSLKQISGKDYDCEDILQRILQRFEHYYAIAEREWSNGKGSETISRLYHSHLYRRKGMHRYRDANGSFEAETIGVKPNGILMLRRKDGTVSEYEFKEISFSL